MLMKRFTFQKFPQAGSSEGTEHDSPIACYCLYDIAVEKIKVKKINTVTLG